VKICDLTQFYSPFSGGVKRYVHEKIAFIEKHSPGDEHVLVIPGAKTELTAANFSRIYSVHSPLLSRTSRYRALLNLRAVEEILERERPDLIESSDPYQLAWKAIASGNALGIPVVGFYHSHFPEAYLRSAAKFLGRTAGEAVMDFSRRYVRHLYNQFEATLVPSQNLAELLSDWGVRNVRVVNLGVNIEIFNPAADEAMGMRHALGIVPEQKLLLYVGRLAKEKNTNTLFTAFELLARRRPEEFHLLIIGDGPQRDELVQLQSRTRNVSWIQYCTDSADLARYYCAADLFVHPGVQETFGLAAPPSSASTAATWIALFFTNRRPGPAKILPKRWPTRSSIRARRSYRCLVRTLPRWLRAFTAGTAYLSNCFAFIVRYAQTTGVHDGFDQR
jgi:alpha-1,6-mannosyltransferase